ncbi:hypothetical protein TNCV_44251 [Trichonephila clavipes]|nr:hypothetical protein TNCV_44251 [Trichonephila clavipes]
MEDGWSNQRVARRVDRSDLTEWSIAMCLAEEHLVSQSPLPARPITSIPRLLRLECCHAGRDWTVAKRNQVIFSDE